MNEITLKLDKRTQHGKKVSHLRQEGFVPSVVYGGHIDPIVTQSATPETVKVTRLAGKHTPVHLTIDGKKQLAIIKAIDIDPVKHSVRHIAFHAISARDTVTTEVPIVLLGEGESEAERLGLVVLQALEQVEVKAQAADLPESLEVSIKDLATTEDKITLGDITLPHGVEYAAVDQDLDLVVANVYEPSALQAANDAAGGDAVEDEADVPAENGSDTDQTSQAAEDRPGGKSQAEPKQSNVDANS